MTRKNIENILKTFHYKIIQESYLCDNKSIRFNAYDIKGLVYNFYINVESGFSTKRLLSPVTVFTPEEINWFRK